MSETLYDYDITFKGSLKILQTMVMKLGSGFRIMVTIVICSYCLLSFFPISAAADIPFDTITGFVVDDYGQPVPDATVTLMQGSMLWQPNKTVLSGIENPQITGSEGDKTGSFVFGLLYPGQYVLTAEKWGYQGSASILVKNTSVHSPYTVNLVLEDFDAALSKEQVTYRGGINGSIWAHNHVAPVYYASVSLWKDGQMVRITGNPQKEAGYNFTFNHLAPGQYTVKVEKEDVSGGMVAENVSVDVGTDIVNADIVMQHYVHHSPPSPTMITATPSQTPTPEPPTATPAPSAGILLIILSAGLTGTLIHKFLRNE